MGWTRGKNERGGRGKEHGERKLSPTFNSQFYIKSKTKLSRYCKSSQREHIYKFWEILIGPIIKDLCFLSSKKTLPKESRNSQRQFTLTYSLITEDCTEY